MIRDFALARRAVACPGWRWMPGMAATWIDRFEGTRLTWTRIIGGDMSAAFLSGSPLPILEDPATRGCVLALVREAWGDPSMSLAAVDESAHPTLWQWVGDGLDAPAKDWHRDSKQWPSEDEALIAALEAAPEANK